MNDVWRRGVVAVALALMFAMPAAALERDPAKLEGDPEAGRIKANACMGCHGIPTYRTVYPTYHVPKIGGQHAAYIISALKAYATGKREHPTMQAQASSLSAQDIADIAAFLSQPRSAE